MTSAFDRLSRPIQKWIRSRGWNELRSIQTEAIHTINDDNSDVIIAASTAGGKTEAAFLPLISQVLESPTTEDSFNLVYVGPLKALITDQASRLEEICFEIDLPVYPWHGDISASVKNRALKKPQGILLITPESLEALFIKRGLEIERLFGSTNAIIIDELHSLLDSERGVQLRSLLTRLEIAIKRPIRRIGLSATLGDMEMAKVYLRPDNSASVNLIKAESGESELQLQLKGYVTGDGDNGEQAVTIAVSNHLFSHLRGKDNLVFAGSRQSVEIYADKLRQLCEDQSLPQEFYPHHANLSRDHRSFVEKRLKDENSPTTAVCTSTLELGIDIGDVICVAQIGSPLSVAALRQRLGRSGRREGQPAILRQYAIEDSFTPKSHALDRLRLGLIRSVAMIELLLQGWCEPPSPSALHLSTLVHQILSSIAQLGGAYAQVLYRNLCKEGPFRRVSIDTFLDVLRAMGSEHTKLIEQTSDGLLLLGSQGEKQVEHYSFYAVFQTPEEFRLFSNGKELGSIPIDNILSKGMFLVFSGRRWVIEEVYNQERIIIVKPAEAGVPPKFGGDVGNIHDRVVQCMFDVLEGDKLPIYMDKTALNLLDEARFQYRELRLETNSIISTSETTKVLATKCGSIKTNTLAMALTSEGFKVFQHDGFIEVEASQPSPTLEETLFDLSNSEAPFLFAHSPNLYFEKFHHFLTEDLLQKDALSQRMEIQHLNELCGSLLLETPSDDVGKIW